MVLIVMPCCTSLQKADFSSLGTCYAAFMCTAAVLDADIDTSCSRSAYFWCAGLLAITEKLQYRIWMFQIDANLKQPAGCKIKSFDFTWFFSFWLVSEISRNFISNVKAAAACSKFWLTVRLVNWVYILDIRGCFLLYNNIQTLTNHFWFRQKNTIQVSALAL